jgi:iron-sulfur cluster repair protein YtfE (RIC family)
MRRNRPETIREQLGHGHSDLIRLLDEVDAHLRGLSAEPDAPDVILEEFVRYADRLHDEVVEHIAEEETELFPMIRTVAGAAQLDELSRLQSQHRQLLESLEAFTAALDELPSKPPAALCAGLRVLRRLASTLREDLRAHSQMERAFLREVEDRLSVTCLRG